MVELSFYSGLIGDEKQLVRYLLCSCTPASNHLITCEGRVAEGERERKGAGESWTRQRRRV